MEPNMPRPLIGTTPMSAAQRQARRRARLGQQTSALPTALPSHPRSPPRPRRWAAAVATLIELQGQYRDWQDGLPDNLHGSALADRLQAIAELDLSELEAIELPRGYGRDR